MNAMIRRLVMVCLVSLAAAGCSGPISVRPADDYTIARACQLCPYQCTNDDQVAFCVGWYNDARGGGEP